MSYKFSKIAIGIYNLKIGGVNYEIYKGSHGFWYINKVKGGYWYTLKGAKQYLISEGV